MKRKLLTILMVFTMAILFSGLFLHSTANAVENQNVTMVEMTQPPTKTTYYSGEAIDFSDMILTGHFNDGTTKIIKDYQIEGYDSSKLGEQPIRVKYQGFVMLLYIKVIPAKVTDISALSVDAATSAYTLSWKAVAGASYYEVHQLDESSGSYYHLRTVDTNSILLYDTPGFLPTYQIRAVGDVNGTIYLGDFSAPYKAATPPDAVVGLNVTKTTSTSVTLSWNEVPGATGYLIYRAPVSSGSFKNIGNVTTLTYTDNSLASSTSYKYKVCAYVYDKSITGEFSPEISTSTNPLRPVLKYKVGDQKVRLTWSKINGASSYDIYAGDEVTGFTLLATNKGNTNTTYIAEGLVTGNTYTFYAVARREYNGVIYDSEPSEKITGLVMETEATSTLPKYYADQVAFEASSAYTNLEFFRNNVDYSKSIVIPGLINTNINGFISTKMCPQGITFAGDYLLLTAYDMASEENSVIYVMDKATGSLLTTLVLPVKAHAGGIGFDGTHVWVAVGTKVSAITYADIQTAVYEGTASYNIVFKSTCELGITASYLTYYDNKLWVGSYNELKATKMYSYLILEQGTSISLLKQNTIKMPTRVQGIAFTEDGYLLLSRSCQLYQGLRGYIRQIDVYRTNFSNKGKGLIPLGEVINSVQMPSMNEEIAIEGGYLYVNFESGAFANASYIMDRISAFDLETIITKPTEEIVVQ